ncbi:DUF4184 family protein [Filimonas effusa]|uniref:DUF4184 family protein n=1 Tax=Filimonas effusa TaxID=2508721 RepID=A0A4Q1DDM6_9BACT|nr:DUF4184 family protein [Filimonas effusa]RXK87078.1 DUF4184 family protein [Filimonas effusa]
MPFTFSHPAIVLPLGYLSRRYISITGLIIGSMAPDFEYFMRMRVHSRFSHTLPGLFLFDLPLGILLAFLFHTIVRNQLIGHLPYFLQSRFTVFEPFDWHQRFRKAWPVVALSIIAGAASHVLWDAFTHETGYFVSIFPVLSSSIEVSGIRLPVLKVLQHGSSFIGMLVIVFTILKMPATVQNKRIVSARYWIAIILLTLLIVVLRFSGGIHYNEYGNMVVTLISAFLISLVLISAITRKSRFA